MNIQTTIDRALEFLGIRNFLLGIHDAAFPSLAEEDLGRGSPYSDGAAGFVKFARSLGFTGVQLGPQGITTPANPSPYDGTIFSRNPLSLAPLPLTRQGCRLLAPETLARLIGQLHPDHRMRVRGSFAREAIHQISSEICNRYRLEIREGKTASATALRESFTLFRRHNAAWLTRDALYQILRQHYGGNDWKHWGESDEARLDRHLVAPPPGREAEARRRFATLFRQHAEAIEEYCFIQFQLAAQHRELRERCRRLGLKLFGDCQIGLSGRDAWYAQTFLLPDYVMGAPPSRTNPEGQPWNYFVLDPRQYFVGSATDHRQPGPAIRFFQARIEKLVDEFDGLRLDHPHGLICPWVYRAYQEDSLYAVQHGARLFACPALHDYPDHPGLAEFAIVRPDQLNEEVARYDDGWVESLDPEQVGRYAQLFAVIMATAGKKWGGTDEIACEILSTEPYPVKRVLEVYGLGRFRVTQKADLNNEQDVYRSENAHPQDWLMLGNHDTAPVWQVADEWFEAGVSRRQADYLATRLRIAEAERTEWIERLAGERGALVQAKFADLFVGPAQNIMVYFTDLLGSKETYNRPGTVSDANWTLRIPADYKRIYTQKLAADLALNIPKALAMALRARGGTSSLAQGGLIRELEEIAHHPAD